VIGVRTVYAGDLSASEREAITKGIAVDIEGALRAVVTNNISVTSLSTAACIEGENAMN
jgi:hypothetical protein